MVGPSGVQVGVIGKFCVNLGDLGRNIVSGLGLIGIWRSGSRLGHSPSQ